MVDDVFLIEVTRCIDYLLSGIEPVRVENDGIVTYIFDEPKRLPTMDFTFEEFAEALDMMLRMDLKVQR